MRQVKQHCRSHFGWAEFIIWHALFLLDAESEFRSFSFKRVDKAGCGGVGTYNQSYLESGSSTR